MGKRAGKRRVTVNARRKQARKLADQAGGVVCGGCGAIVEYERATFVMSGDQADAFCLACAIERDAGGIVQLLWDTSEWADGTPTHRSEGGREFVPHRGVLVRDQG